MTSPTQAQASNWITGYQKAWLRYDVVAGLTSAAVVIPKAMAYATIAGLPVEVGLYTALVPMVIYAVLGTSRVLSVSTTTTIAILVGTELAVAVPGADAATLLRATATLALLVGAILLVASLFRLGFIASFISEPVLIGFKAGIGLVIILDQLPKLLGVHFDKGHFLHNLLAIIQSLPGTSLPTLAIGAGTIVVLVALERWLPRAPAPLIAAAAGIGVMSLLGAQSGGVAVVGLVPRGLPSLVWPDPALLAVLWPGALGIALMSFTETVASARAFAATGDPPLGAMPSGGGTSQTAVNRNAGARTQLSELVTAGTTLLTMLFLAGPMGLLPQPTLAAVVIFYSVGLIDPAGFRSILRVRRMEFIWAVAALAGVVLLGTLQGIVVAIIVSLLGLARQAANPPVYVLGRKPGTNVFRPRTAEHPEDESIPGLLLLGLTGRVFFLNASRIGDRFQPLINETRPRAIVIDMSAVSDLEFTALKALIEAEHRMRQQGVLVSLAGLTPDVLEVVQRSSLGETLGRERMHFTLEIAVQKFLAAGSPSSPAAG
jgi:MFS superfamily sulfate permease-like transporter